MAGEKRYVVGKTENAKEKKPLLQLAAFFINFEALDSLKFAPLFLFYSSLSHVMGPQELGWDSANLSPKEVTFLLLSSPKCATQKTLLRIHFQGLPSPFSFLHSLSPPPPFTVLSSSPLLFFTHRPSVYPVSSSPFSFFCPAPTTLFPLITSPYISWGPLPNARGKKGEREVFSPSLRDSEETVCILHAIFYKLGSFPKNNFDAVFCYENRTISFLRTK